MDRLDRDRMFLAVFDGGSFAEAARTRGTSAGQASKLVARLEADLGAQLFHRTTRAVRPTEIGLAYAARVRGLVEEYDALDLSVQAEAAVPRGRLRLTVPASLGAARLGADLSAFAAAHPEIALEVDFSDRIAALVDEGYDAAVRVGEPAEGSLIARRLGRWRLTAVAAPAYLAAAGRPERPADLARHACILDRNFADPTLWPLQEDGAPVRVSGRIAFSSAAACLAAAEAGLGIACMPDFVAREALEAGRVEEVLARFAGPERGIYALYPPSRHLAPKVRALVDFLVRRMSGGYVPKWNE